MNQEPVNLKSLSESKVELGNKLRALRLSKGLTMVDLAVKCDTDASYVGKLERGVLNPSFESLKKYLAALDIDIISAIFK